MDVYTNNALSRARLEVKLISIFKTRLCDFFFFFKCEIIFFNMAKRAFLTLTGTLSEH